MKAPQIILLVLAFGIGAGIVFALKPGGDDKANTELENKLAAAEKRLAELEAQRSKTTGDIPVPAGSSNTGGGSLAGVSAIPEAVEGDAEPESPEDAMAKIFNSPEARNLMKGIAGAMSSRADGWISGAVGEYKEKLNLTDAQVESITSRMGAMMEENTKRFQADMDDSSRSMQEIMQEQGDFWQNNETEIEAMLQDELSEDQFAQFEREQLVERTERVQKRADRELEAMDSKLELSEAQEDQVFSILVRESPEYDDSMGIEGVETTLPAGATGDDVAKDDAIRSVLNPDQVETYNATLESGGFNPRRRGPWGRGPGGFR